MVSSGRIVILLVAGVIVVFAIIAIRNYMSDQPAPPPEVPAASTRVIVAKHDIAPGVMVQAGVDIDWAEPPADAANTADMLHEGVVHIQDFNGAVSRRQLHTNEPVTHTSLTKAGEGGFMSAVLEPGMRAVSIAVNTTSGNAGFVSPGDRIDLIVTYHIKQSSGGNNESIVSETFVHNVRVVAVDQMLDNPDNKAILAKTITVEVDSQQAAQISVANELGKVSIVLRSLVNDKNAAQIPPAADGKTPAEAAAGQPTEENPITDLYGNTKLNGKPGANPDDTTDFPLQHKALSPRIRIIRGEQSENVEF